MYAYSATAVWWRQQTFNTKETKNGMLLCLCFACYLLNTFFSCFEHTFVKVTYSVIRDGLPWSPYFICYWPFHSYSLIWIGNTCHHDKYWYLGSCRFLVTGRTDLLYKLFTGGFLTFWWHVVGTWHLALLEVSPVARKMLLGALPQNVIRPCRPIFLF